MGAVDSDYAERYSHATVSRWESGGTRPTLQRLKVFGQALNLSQTEVAGLVLLAGLAPDFRTALDHVSGHHGDRANGQVAATDSVSTSRVEDVAGASEFEIGPSVLRSALRFGLLRVLPLGVFMAGGYALSIYGWNNVWMPTAYVAFALGIVLAQGFLVPDRRAGLREFFWVSLFFLLTTPLLQFAPIHMDHYEIDMVRSRSSKPNLKLTFGLNDRWETSLSNTEYLARQGNRVQVHIGVQNTWELIGGSSIDRARFVPRQQCGGLREDMARGNSPRYLAHPV